MNDLTRAIEELFMEECNKEMYEAQSIASASLYNMENSDDDEYYDDYMFYLNEEDLCDGYD